MSEITQLIQHTKITFFLQNNILNDFTILIII